MNDPASAGSCLNCGAPLEGAFCSRCGQRAIPAYPTMRELAGDAWHELTGYDGRLARAVRMLFRRPGALTVEVLEGRRAQYVSPVRLYLAASLAYFLIAAAVPDVRPTPSARLPGSGIVVDPMADGGGITEEQRVAALKDIDRAPPYVRAVLRPMVVNPAEFRASMRARVPRVLFALVPVFAAILALFFRKRRFSQHLIFSLHLHTVIFLALVPRELINLTRYGVAVIAAQLVVLVLIGAYGLAALRTVYGESLLRTTFKAAGATLMYIGVTITALFVTAVWTALASG